MDDAVGEVYDKLARMLGIQMILLFIFSDLHKLIWSIKALKDILGTSICSGEMVERMAAEGVYALDVFTCGIDSYDVG